MTNTDQPTSLGSGTVAALESAWADIRSVHPDVAEHVVFRLGSGREGRRGSMILGSITVAETWQDSRKQASRATSEPKRYRELFIAGETLAQHPIDLLQTLIHEAAHSVAFTRDVKETSRQHRYHNKRFRGIAEEMGLAWTHLGYQTVKDDDGVKHTLPNPDFDETEPHDIRKNSRFLTCEAKADEVIGFSDMHITKATAKAYRDTVTNLDTNVSVQLGGGGGFGRAPKKRRTVVVFPGAQGGKGGLAEKEDVLALLGLGLDDPIDAPEFELDPQRLGVVVYEGLIARKLLGQHAAYVEEL